MSDSELTSASSRGGTVAAVLRALGERIRQRVDALFQMRQRVAAAGGERDVFDVLRQPLHLGGELVDHLVGGDMRADVAQRGDGVFELLHRRRVLLGDDQVDLVREAVDRVVEADQVFRRRQMLQRVAHFGEAVLDAGQRVAVDAGLPSLGDALGQPRDLPLDGVDRAPRHRLGERVGDLAELVAQRVDRFLDARRAQRLDLVVMVRSCSSSPDRSCVGSGARGAATIAGIGGIGCGRLPRQRLAAVERALPRGNFRDRKIERRRQAASRGASRRRASAPAARVTLAN